MFVRSSGEWRQNETDKPPRDEKHISNILRYSFMISTPDNPIPEKNDEAAVPLAVGAAVPVFADTMEPNVRKGILSIIDQAIVSGANFLTMAIIARACSPDEVGLYALGWTVVMFMVAAQANLISIPYTMYFHRRDGASLAEYGGSAIVHQLVLSVVAAAGFVILAAMLSSGIGPSGMKSTALVLSVAIPFILLRDFVRRFSFAHLSQETAIIIDIAVSSLQIVGLFLLWEFGSLSTAGAYLVMGVACAVAIVGWWLFKKPSVRFSRDVIVRDWRENWAFGRWTITGQLTGLAFYALPWMLAFVQGEAETGRLAVCTTLVGLSNLFVMGLNNFVMPKAAHAFNRNGAGALGGVLWKALLASVGVLGSLCLAVFLVGNLVAGLIFGPTYADSGILLTVLAVSALIDSIGLTAGAGLWALNRPAANFAADVVQVAVTILAAVWLVFSHGALGIAIAIVAGRIVGAAVRWGILWTLIGQTKSNEQCEATC